MSLTLRPHQLEALQVMAQTRIGQILVPTGGGKTLIAIMDVVRSLENAGTPQTIVVVAPRILLAQQLCEEYMEVLSDMFANVIPAHIHSGSTPHFSTTNIQKIHQFEGVMATANLHRIYFTTYNSLPRLAEAGVSVDAIYFDEAHNSTRNDFYPATKYFSQTASRCYYFTATPKHSVTSKRHGMNECDVYGQVIYNVPAPTLVQGGFIIPPQVKVKEMEFVGKHELISQRDTNHLISCIDDNNTSKVLVCAKSVKQIMRMFSETDISTQLTDRGFSYMYISAKTGGVVDGKKVSRTEFFNTLNLWGKDNSKKFIVLHHSILSEGINVSGLESAIFLRTMDHITISQTIGRVIRLHKDDAQGMRDGTIRPGDLSSYTKSFGLCIVPVYSKTQQTVAKSLQSVVNTVFIEGEAATTVVRR